MASTTHSALVCLLDDLLSLDSIQLLTEPPGPVDAHTKTLMLQAAGSSSAKIAQLVEINLHILLNQYPFSAPSTDLKPQQQRFFRIWTGEHELELAPGKSTVQGREQEKEKGKKEKGDRENTLPAAAGLSFLSEIRPNFQRLGNSGFHFIFELLLSCLQKLSPEGTSKNPNIRGWVGVHATAITVLSELLYSIPTTSWPGLDEQAECVFPVWQCLQLLTTGATWWGSESSLYRESMLRLAKCICAFLAPLPFPTADGVIMVVKLPCSASLLRGLHRVDMRPPDVHSIITTVLQPLERQLGIATSGYINAFTPSPYSFPIVTALDRHDFTMEYEFANLRVMFVSWINSDLVTRRMEEFKAPWDIEAVLQHTEAYRRLKAHPESAVRVALIYIFNEVQRGCEGMHSSSCKLGGGRYSRKTGFKPCSDARAVELLQIYISYVCRHPHMVLSKTPATTVLNSNATSCNDLQISPESCLAANAEWAIPWVWKRRSTDSTFAMAMTTTWLAAACNGPLSETHAAFKIISKHAESAFSVFHVSQMLLY